MSVMPTMFANLFDGYPRPSRMYNQHFGLGLDAEDLLSPLTLPIEKSMLRCPANYYRPWKSLAAQKDTGSTVHFDKDKFQVNLDVQHFHPEEISVRVTGDHTIVVEGKHDDKQDEHGFITRHFIRKYMLPKGHDVNQVVSHLSSDGVLTIMAPKIDKEKQGVRAIPITHTGQPSKAIEAKAAKDEHKEKK